jgi:molybdate transport system substrate-binding protein
VVFAAASLTAPFEQLAAAFAQRHPDHGIDLHFAGTPRLVLQLREGAPADVLAAADETNMQQVVAAGSTLSPPVVFAHNRLTIVVAKGNPKAVRGLADLARDDLRVVLCAAAVPAGRYARQLLARAGVVVHSRSDEPSVKAVVSKVALGEVDAGIVYVTDVVATYPIAVLNGGHHRDIAAEFVAFVLSADGRAILRRHGFASP